MPMENRKICKGTTKEGQPCGALALENSDFCKSHDPNYVGKIGRPRKTGYYATAIQDEKELNDYLEALTMTHIEKLNDISSMQMMKSKILARTDIDDKEKTEMLLRFTDAATRATKAAADIESKTKVSDAIKGISWLWGEGEGNGAGQDAPDDKQSTED